MAGTNYTLRIDEVDKQQAELVFRSLGMNLSTGINIYIKAVSRQQRIPFDLDLNAHTEKVVMDAKKSLDDKKMSYNALEGILSNHEVDLDKEREERIMAQ